MTINMKELLSKPVDDVKRPPPMPTGTYYGIISGYKYVETAWVNNETGEKDAQVRYSIRNLDPQGIDESLFEEIDLTKVGLNADLPLTGGNEYVTKEFLENLGVDTRGKGWMEICPEAVGQEVMFDVHHRMNKESPEAPPFVSARNLRKKPE
jgi:hypothetical protein